MKLFSRICIIALIFSVVACGDRNINEENEHVILKSYRLIDEERTNEAIELLEAELAKDPSNYDYKIVLASAYAHKGGIKIQKLVPVIAKTEQAKKLKVKFAEIKDNQPINDKVNIAAMNTAKLLTQFAQFFETYVSVPVMDIKQAVYVRHAIYLLNETEDSIRPEDALYRAILGIVLFKHILADDLIGEFVKPQGDDVICRFDLGNVNDTFIELGKLLIDVLNDIGYANSKQAKDMKSMSENVAETVSNLTLATTSLIVIDEASSLFLQQALVQNGFGKLIKCGGD